MLSLGPRATTENGINEKDVSSCLFIFIIKRDVAAWIVRGSGMNHITGTHVTRCLGVPLYVVFVSLLNMGVGSVSTHQIPVVLCWVRTFLDLYPKSRQCQNTTPTRDAGILLTILDLAIVFCNNSHSFFLSVSLFFLSPVLFPILSFRVMLALSFSFSYINSFLLYSISNSHT